MKNRFLFPGFYDAFVLLFLCFLLPLQLTTFADDPGLGWHLANGDLILSSFSITRIDPFLYSSEPRNWISDQWLGDVALSAMYKFGEWPFLHAILVLMHAYGFLVLLPKLGFLFSGSFLAAITASVLSFKLSQVHFIARPTLFSFLFFIVTLTLALKKNCSRFQMIFLPVLFLLWANIHPAFVLGIGVLVLSVLLSVFFDRTAVKGRVYLCLVCAIVTFINPFGPALHKSIFELGNNAYFMALNTEWAPVEILSFEGKLFLCLSLFAAVGCLAKRLDHSTLLLTLLSLIFAALSLKAVRFLPFFAAASAPLAALGLKLLAQRIFGGLTLFRSEFRKLELREVASAAGIVGFAVSSLVYLACSLFYSAVPFFQDSYGPRSEIYPSETIKYLARRAIQSDSVQVVLSHPNWGGILAFEAMKAGVGTKLKGVIDDRNTLLGENFYRDYFKIMLPSDTFLDNAKVYDANFLLLPVESQLAKFILSQKKLLVLYRDPVSILFSMGEQ